MLSGDLKLRKVSKKIRKSKLVFPKKAVRNLRNFLCVWLRCNIVKILKITNNKNTSMVPYFIYKHNFFFNLEKMQNKKKVVKTHATYLRVLFSGAVVVVLHSAHRLKCDQSIHTHSLRRRSEPATGEAALLPT